jgi:CHAT domain-containing protein
MDMKARSRVFFQGLLAGVILLVALAPPAAGQGGQGRGRNRQPDQPKSEQPRQEKQAKPELAPGQYSPDGPDVLEAINRGEGPQAMAYFERAAKEDEQQGNLVRAARENHAVSIIANRMGRYQKGIQAASHAVELFKKASGLTPHDQTAWASSYSHLGSAYRQLGDLAKARQSYEEGLAYVKANMRGRGAGQSEGFLLNDLATVAYMQKDYQTALAYNTQAAQYFESVESSRQAQNMPERTRQSLRRWAANSYFGIGRDQQALGNPDAADAAFAKGLSYARLTGLRESEMQMLSAQANLAVARKDWAKALGLYQQSIALVGQTKLTRGVPNLYLGQARALEGLGRMDEALASMRETVRLIEEVRADVTDADLRTGFFEGKQGVYQHAVHLALQAQKPEEAFTLSEQSRSRTFLDLLGSQTTLSKGRTRALVTEEVQLRARLAEAKAEAEQSEGVEESTRAKAQADALDRDYKAFVERVKKENIEQASLMSVEPVKLAEIQALLPEGTTLLEYYAGEGGVYVWIVDRTRFKLVQLPGDRPSLMNQVRNFRGAITKQAPIGNVQGQATALYRRLIEPALADIQGQRLLIVPHGVLHYLPFASLRSPGRRWLVQDFALSTLPSASVLRYLTDKGAKAPANALVMGNPDLGAELALPWAEREARMVGQQEKDSTVFVRADATEAQAKKLLETVGIVHFATHGDLSETDPLSSAVLLVPGGGEDGRLEVREVFALDLHAKLVVLSACETGLGKLSRGDEVVGLQRAFLYAGTPAVVTTLWKVDDKATYDLIRAFYSKLEGAGAVEALRQAQLETMATYPHPYQWAAFNLTGAPR